MRVLISIKPRLYRESLALTLRRYRPDFEVRVAAPEDVEEEIRSFAPQLLVRNDTDGLDEGVLQRVPFAGGGALQRQHERENRLELRGQRHIHRGAAAGGGRGGGLAGRRVATRTASPRGKFDLLLAARWPLYQRRVFTHLPRRAVLGS